MQALPQNNPVPRLHGGVADDAVELVGVGDDVLLGRLEQCGQVSVPLPASFALALDFRLNSKPNTSTPSAHVAHEGPYRKYAALLCGHLDFASAVTAQNDQLKVTSFHSSSFAFVKPQDFAKKLHTRYFIS